MNLWSAIYSAPEGYSRPPKRQQLRRFGQNRRNRSTAQPHSRFSDSGWRTTDSGWRTVRIYSRGHPLAGGSNPFAGGLERFGPYLRTLIQKEPGQVGNSSPSPIRLRLRLRPAVAASGGAHVRMYVHSSLLFARENSKYPKGTPFVLNFLYLYYTSFHPTAMWD